MMHPTKAFLPTALMNALFLILLLFMGCNNRDESASNYKIEKGDENAHLHELKARSLETPYVWENYLCLLPEFAPFFYCDSLKKDRFEAVFFRDPIKGPIHISLGIKNEKIEDVYFVNMHFSSDSINLVSKKFSRHIAFSMPVTGNRMVCSYDPPIAISSRSLPDDLNVFFSQLIWELPFSVEGDEYLDSEVWSVMGRKEGKEYYWSRQSFKDTVFCANLQLLLDLCRVEDFKYRNQ
jgi:hypothetical protein